MQREDTPSAAVAHPNAPLTPRDFMDKKTDTTKRFRGIPYMFLMRREVVSMTGEGRVSDENGDQNESQVKKEEMSSLHCL